MAAIRIFISSVQKEFSEERKALAKYIREDVLLCKFFQPFIFEELPAINLSAPETILWRFLLRSTLPQKQAESPTLHCCCLQRIRSGKGICHAVPAFLAG